MRLDALREFCLSLPACGEKLQWGEHILFTVADKMFCMSTVEPASPTQMKICFKCTPERFAELIEREGVIPAPYLARNHWVALTTWDALPTGELQQSVRESHRLVFGKLPKRVQAGLSTKTTPALKKSAQPR